MATRVFVPLLGEGVEEVTVTRWLKREGDKVDELEPLLEVNTDKVDTEIPAPASGTVLKILAGEGEAARVGAVLAWIGSPGEAVDGGEASGGEERAAAPAGPVPDRDPSPDGGQQPASKRETGFISPVVARVAAEHGIDLQEVQGTGMNGRITKNDVLIFVEQGSPKPARTGPPPAAAPVPGAGDQLIRHTAIRKQIAEHMVMSKHTSPHVLTVMEADMSRVAKHRSASREMFARDGVNLTFTPYFLMAVVAGLKAHPRVNASWREEGILVHRDIHLGMATSLGEEGLIVPVIRGADNLSLLAMARAVNDLAQRARTKKLQADEVRGGTFTLTNHGTSGSLFAFPVINQPQCGILGVGAVQKRVVVIDDAIAVRPMVYLSFVFDHRVLDGAAADAFLMQVKETLENWTERS